MRAEIVFFPIRHHSPACAWRLARLIRERSPRAILIEGPRDATPLLPSLASEQTRAPVAIYTTFVDTTHLLHPFRPGPLGRANPARFAAYYPLADYSPELVAIRQGRATGASVRFIDLTFPEMVVNEHRHAESAARDDGAPLPTDAASGDAPSALAPRTRADDDARGVRLRSLLDEQYLRQSAYLRALCERVGARDADDLWDHLYESDFQSVPTDEFIRRVETYCALSRADYTDETLAAEGHPAREAAMAQAIADAARDPANDDGVIFVVTGGFHTPALRERVEALLTDDAPPPDSAAPLNNSRRGARGAKVVASGAAAEPGADGAPIPGEARTLLMRYDFAQLDRLNGYASGMPSPGYYQRVWDDLTASDPQPPARVAAQVVVELGRQTRAHGPGLSPADEIAALDLTLRLAAFRGHPQPTREDMLDGVRSACVKGMADAEGALILGRVRTLLTGDRIGDLPPDVGVAPLVDDFRRTAAQLRIDLSTLQAREATLDLYRSVSHRAISRFFYRLDYLGAGFARKRQGPDFVQGYELERIREVWEYRWGPGVEATLTEQSLYGATLEEACATLLQREQADVEDAGMGRRSDVAATQLLRACRMGLQRYAPELLARTAALMAEDASLPSLVNTAEQLLLLRRSREPLEAHDLTGLDDVARAAYDRACYLLPTLGAVTDEDVDAALDGLNGLPQVALALGDDEPTHLLRREGMRALVESREPGQPTIVGGAVGALYADGQLSEDGLVVLVAGRLDHNGPAFLRGLLRTNRACIWQSQALLATLNQTIGGWSDDAFLRLLPELRLAFADLTAREADQVARNVAALLGVSTAPSLTIADATPADLLVGARLDQRLRAALARDGLADFIGAPVDSDARSV